MRLRSVLLILALPCLVQVLAAAPVVASASFVGGIFGTWDFGFTTGPPNLHLLQITIDLSPANLIFDTTPAAPGSLASQDIGGYEGTDAVTGLFGIVPGTGAALNGGQLLTFQFNDFTVGETFHFTGDVDNPDPALSPLENCSIYTGLARLACNIRNAARTVQNDARLLAASLVTSPEFAGALVTLQFGGPGYYTSDFTGTFEPAGGLRFTGSIENEVQAIPEPATFISLAAGILLLGCLRRRRVA